MSDRDERVDAHIERAADFAKPILRHLRRVVHGACPEVVETLRWGFPHFDYRGVMCSMAAFKAHCTFGFRDGGLVMGEDAADEKAMGQFGRITALSDLPPEEVLAGYVEKAVALKDAGVKPSRSRAPSPSARRDYVEWITEAKRDATRARRIATAVQWMAEGKPRNWKYMK